MNDMDYLDSIIDDIREKKIDSIHQKLNQNQEIIHVLDRKGGTLLHEAVKSNLFEIVEKLINMGIDINIKTRNIGSAINLSRNSEMADYLLEKGLEIDMSLNLFISNNPIKHCIARNDVNMVRYWVEKELEINSELDFKNELIKNTLEKAEISAQQNIVEMMQEEYVNESKLEEKTLEFDFGIYEKKMFDALKECFVKEKNKCDKTIYGIALTTDMRLDGLGIVLNTKERLVIQEAKDYTSKVYLKYDVDEWEIWNVYDDKLQQVAKDVSSYANQVRENKELFNEFRETIYNYNISILKKLRKSGFVAQTFGKDILLMYHVRDYYRKENFLENARALNSEYLLQDLFENFEE